MRLADHIIDSTGSNFDFDGDISRLAGKVSTAEHFELSPEILAACWNVSGAKPSSVVSALSMARMPYKDVWVEWVPVLLAGRREATDQEPIPERMGVLLETMEEHFLRVTWCFRHKGNPHFTVCPIGQAVDLGDGTSRLPPDHLSLVRTAAVQIEMQKTERMKRFSLLPGEVEAAAELARRVCCLKSPYTDGLAKLAMSGQGVELYSQANIKIFVSDIEGEIGQIVSWLIMLNSKNAVEIGPRDDLSRLNKQRKARGKRPLCEFSITRLKLPSHLAQAGKRGVGREIVRQHLVRGHFKMRPSGVFWWSPHVRGDAAAGVLVRDRYAVKG